MLILKVFSGICRLIGFSNNIHYRFLNLDVSFFNENLLMEFDLFMFHGRQYF